jgi:hypothetical protein
VQQRPTDRKFNELWKWEQKEVALRISAFCAAVHDCGGVAELNKFADELDKRLAGWYGNS